MQVKIEELTDKPFFLTEKNENYRRELDAFLEAHNLQLTPAVEISNTDFIIRQLKESGGISCLPFFAVEESLRKGELTVLEVEGMKMEMVRQIFYHKSKWKTREMEEFIRRVREIWKKTGRKGEKAVEISLNRDSTTPLYQQLRNQIRDQIISGELTDGFKLPSERQLVERLEIHRNTVKKAYEQLMKEGLIYSSAKSPRGYFVRGSRADAAAKDAQNERFGMRRAFSSLDKNFNYQFLGMQNTFQRFYNSSYLSEAIPFAGVLANEEALPMEYLREILREMAQESTLEPFWFCDPQGTERFL